MAPGDIMILVRRRRDLAARIVARLQALHVPVAGVDRFALTQPLAVQDLIAAMRFAVQPLDDLNLAALLVSPLLGWTQDELYARTAKRGRAAIWEHLRSHEETMPPATMEALRALLGMADFTTPFRFLETILSGPIDGRRKLYARLGREARDPIDELLSQALAFEARETVSLLGFLTRIAGSSADIKRQTEARSDVVRVMTVHGSKGLQAPIVILADATDDAAIGHRPFTVDVAAWEKLPVFAMPADERQGALAQAYQDAADAAAQEHWRLFYVAMTRAEEMLIVAGVTKSPTCRCPRRAGTARPRWRWRGLVAIGRMRGRCGAAAVSTASMMANGRAGMQLCALRRCRSRCPPGPTPRHPRRRARRARSRPRRWAKTMLRCRRRVRRASRR